MSEGFHLSVPSSLDLPDKYPVVEETGPDNLASTAGVGLRRSPHASAMKRSLTVSEDQPPPTTLSAAGTTRPDLRHGPCLSPFLSPKEGSCNTGFPVSLLDVAVKGNFREQGGLSLHVPLSPKGFGSLLESVCSLAPFKDSQVDTSTVQQSGAARVGHREDLSEGSGAWLATEPSGSDPPVGGDTEGVFQSSLDATDRCPSTNSFVSVVEDTHTPGKSDAGDKADTKEQKMGDSVEWPDESVHLDKGERENVEKASDEILTKVEKQQQEEAEQNGPETIHQKALEKMTEPAEEKLPEKEMPTEKVESPVSLGDSGTTEDGGNKTPVESQLVDLMTASIKVERAAGDKSEKTVQVSGADEREETVVMEETKPMEKVVKVTEVSQKSETGGAKETKDSKAQSPQNRQTAVVLDTSFDTPEKHIDTSMEENKGEDTKVVESKVVVSIVEHTKVEEAKVKVTMVEDAKAEAAEEQHEKVETERQQEAKPVGEAAPLKENATEEVKKTAEKEAKKEEKKEKPGKLNTTGTKKPAARPPTGGSAAGRDLASPEKKTKTTAAAAAKPTSAPAAATKKPSGVSTSRPSSSVNSTSTTTREVKTKVTTVNAARATAGATATRTGGTTAATSKTSTTASATSRTTAGVAATSRTTTTAAATSRTTTASATSRTTTVATGKSATATRSAAAARPALGTGAKKPLADSSKARPSSTLGASRVAGAARTAAAKPVSLSSSTAAAGGSVRSKIGSADNLKPQPGGGKVSQNRGASSKDPSQGKVLNKKVDLSKVTSKCGSKDNMKHKPGGGDVKIESHKVNFKDKAQSKVGSMENLVGAPGKGEGNQEETMEEGLDAPLVAADQCQAPEQGLPEQGPPEQGPPEQGPPKQSPSEQGPPEQHAAQENGLKKDGACGTEGLCDAPASLQPWEDVEGGGLLLGGPSNG
ncbi:hypothetical protein NHX12_021551 [Muraenolepis orangiensis]|uniref:Microtubule-associated protein n=1 Tax=Muraenolepis orangiensis TaxID=630683 RepID=A0A9Q0ETD9_9TELE|nr:hypothetical protein NHX12_021551 [Muraenolepis orangiensis]